ncbi:hypothetical protein H6P81_001289 [Aristolochia fimbriata]|uniref:Uncharacterized protein n=1 Tax=Aristolochia fimbriata TaxID=158543 RepID=A0AAV7FAC3_ARIFI|nr:hypothetical protein H6P81_001289 [Aristolochia fimbriata]
MGNASHYAPSSFLLLAALVLLASSTPAAVTGSHVQINRRSRSLMSFSERKGNATFECSPAGPCVACQYSEKNDDKYRCSETGYRIPLKCTKTKGGDKEASGNKRRRSILERGDFVTSLQHLRWRRLLGDSSKLDNGKSTYITYRSCVPAVYEEKLSVLGFEGIIVGLLILSAPVVYIRRKRSINMPGVGAVRISTNSRF